MESETLKEKAIAHCLMSIETQVVMEGFFVFSVIPFSTFPFLSIYSSFSWTLNTSTPRH